MITRHPTQLAWPVSQYCGVGIAADRGGNFPCPDPPGSTSNRKTTGLTTTQRVT